MTLFAQINCSDVPLPGWPDRGLVLFFCEDNSLSGRQSMGRAKVLWIDSTQPLQPAPYPPQSWLQKTKSWLQVAGPLPMHPLRLRSQISLPDYELLSRGLQCRIQQLPQGRAAYHQLKQGLIADRQLQLGGYPNPRQHLAVFERAAWQQGVCHMQLQFEDVYHIFSNRVSGCLHWYDDGKKPESVPFCATKLLKS